MNDENRQEKIAEIVFFQRIFRLEHKKSRTNGLEADLSVRIM